MAETREKNPMLERSWKAGLVAGVAAIYFPVVGMTERFDDRTVIHEVIRLGNLIFILIALGVGYLVAKPRPLPGEEPERPTLGVLKYGALAGGIAGAMTGLFLFFGDKFEFRRVLVAVTNGLIELLSYGGSIGSGMVFMIVGGAALGAIGAGMQILTDEWRKPLIRAFFVTLMLSLVEPLFTGMLREAGIPREWLYTGGGLSQTGAVIVFVAALAATYLWRSQGEALKRGYTEAPEGRQTAFKLGGLGLVALVLLLLPLVLTSFLAEVLGTVGLYVILGLGLNIVVGYAGLLDLGYVAFLAVGSYSTALLVSPRSSLAWELPYWQVVPITIALATVIGILIGAPVLRLRGDYLAIVTLAFGEIARIIVLSDWAKPSLGGAQGILGIRAPELFGVDLRDPKNLYYAIVITVMLVAFISARLSTSRVGRAWNAMREDEQVAEAMGVSIIGYKLLAFATGAALGSLSGMFFAIKLGSVFASSFNIIVSINVLALIILGGMGSIPGVVIGAFVLVGLPELLREFAEYRLLIYGIILVALMLLKPEGLLPSRRRKAELHIEEDAEEQFAKEAGTGGAEPAVT